MYINHTKKICFFRVPKTASTTCMFMLRMATDPNDDVIWSANPQGFQGGDAYGLHAVSGNAKRNPAIDHLTPSDALMGGFITLEQLKGYNCYAFLRNPIDRYMSAHAHFNRNIPGHNKPDPQLPMEYGLLTRPQKSWFHCGEHLVCEPLWFNNFAEELKRILYELSGLRFPVLPRLNSSSVKPEPFDTYFPDDNAKERVMKVLETEMKFYALMKERSKV